MSDRDRGKRDYTFKGVDRQRGERARRADRKGSIDSIKCMVIDLERVMGRGTGVRL